MQYVELKEALKDFTIFSLNDIKRIDRSFFRTRLNEWQGKGYIKKVIKGYYIFSDLELNENALFEIANKIYKPSYISFETALSFYHLIPESVYGITSASTRRTCYIEIPDSQDLDFDNLGLEEKDFEELVKLIQRRLKLEGYTAETKFPAILKKFYFFMIT